MNLPRLTYVFDPLCGWCYGFSPVIGEIAEAFRGRVDVRVIAGGMIVGETRPISEMRGYIKGVLPSLSELTGVSFGSPYTSGIVDEGNYLLDSVPSSIAMTVFTNLAPDRAVAFAGDLQRAHFVDGKSLNDTATFTEVACKHGIAAGTFLEKYNEKQSHDQTFAAFEQSRSLGVTGFPTLLFSKSEGEHELVSRGYRNFIELSADISARLT